MMSEISEIEKFVRKLKYPAHCIGCEGIDESVENPVHHPSYEVTPSCNLECIFCYSRIAKLKGKAPKPGYYGSLSPKAITISQYGEPFVAGSERVAYIITRLREMFGEVRIDIQTNGTLVDYEKVDGLVDIFMVSLDASNKESYFRLTGSKLFDKAVETIKTASKSCRSVVRTIYLPGLNDGELRGIAEIASEADELFLQPVSLYRENEKLIELIDISRAERIGDFLKAAYRISDVADVRIPGCILLNIRNFLKDYEFGDIMFLRRSVFGNVPLMRREWRFEL
jgi:MoaA/NifB/PqqE/SkfB family radical SAM enzyme